MAESHTIDLSALFILASPRQTNIDRIEMDRTIDFRVVEADIAEVGCDVIALKYAQGWYGAAKNVIGKLRSYGALRDMDVSPEPHDSAWIQSIGATTADRVLVVGTPSLHSLDYPQILEFGRDTIKAVVAHDPGISR
jgi:hypothetical protein